MADGLLLDIRLTPKGGRDAIDGMAVLADGRTVLKVRVRAVPQEGQANAGVSILVARICGLPGLAVTVSAGHKARLKTLRIAGNPAALAARLGTFLARPISKDEK